MVTINDGDLSVLTLWDIHTHKVKTGEGQKLPSELRSGPSYAFTAYGGELGLAWVGARTRGKHQYL